MTTEIDFGSLGLREELVAACQGHGYRLTMAIQRLAIPHLLAGKDLLIQAKTGSGKTLAYGLPILQQDPQQTERPEALIITPTRELARQVAAELTWAGATLHRQVQLVDGGGRAERQRSQLARGCQIVVATPGRLLDLLRSGAIGIDRVRTFVLDEADELIQRGFADELAAIAALLPEKRQTILCSATIPVEVEMLAKQYARRPERVGEVAGKDLPAEVSHQIVYTSIDERTADLITWLKLERPYQALIFTGSRKEADELTPFLHEAGLDVEAFHGELSPVRRRQLIDRFRAGDLPILVATDIAARGLDLPGVTHVVNHSLPRGLGAYVHRTGRTGRAGRKGVAISLVIPQELDRLERLKTTFAFSALTIKGAKAGEVRALHSEKHKQGRDERRGLTVKRAADKERKAMLLATEGPSRGRGGKGKFVPPGKVEPSAEGRSRFAPTQAIRDGIAPVEGPPAGNASRGRPAAEKGRSTSSARPGRPAKGPGKPSGPRPTGKTWDVDKEGVPGPPRPGRPAGKSWDADNPAGAGAGRPARPAGKS
ncbi:MAG: DEAD/DEAH box helicase, partial [Candidatus Sericytochromatia bacterium]|nr:DEAD/DEAH box helicase [Candidatus Sericytochromatia bacterium]